MAAPPANTTPPTITGTPPRRRDADGAERNLEQQPDRVPVPVAALQRERSRLRTNISGAVEKTYLLTSADSGRTMRVRVTGINAEGAVNARSAPTAAVAPSAAPRNTARPAITGDPEVGQELTAEDGTWTNAPTAFAYQWQRCDVDAVSCVDVVGATGEDLRRPRLRRRLPASPRGDRPECERRRLGSRGAVRHRRSVRAGDECAADGEADLGPLPRRPRVRAVPDLRRLAAEPDHPRDRLEAGEVSQTRRFTTRIAPNPCGVYTRSWVPAARFRGKGAPRSRSRCATRPAGRAPPSGRPSSGR